MIRLRLENFKKNSFEWKVNENKLRLFRVLARVNHGYLKRENEGNYIRSLNYF